MYQELKFILSQFKLNGNILSIEPCGSGRINKTFKVVTYNNGRHEYILQRINTDLFTEPQKLMENIENVTSFLKNNKPQNSNMEILSVVKTRRDENFVSSFSGTYRIYDYIKNSVSYNSCENNTNLFQDCGRIFGEFQYILDKFDASKLYETIPDFHNTKKRYEAFLSSIQSTTLDRLKLAKNTIIEFRQFGETLNLANLIVDKLASGELPMRVTHNDTKLNNVAFDKTTNKATAVLDLDTIMPGAICYDFGDAIRYGCNTCSEESIDFGKINFNRELFEKFTRGYLKEASKFLTKNEVDSLVDGAMVMTFELGLRFLTDFLNGDTYFGAKYYENNLDRAKNQLALLFKMKENETYMKNFVDNEYNNIISSSFDEN